MEKTVLDFNEISDDFFAPGNIFWKKKSGVEILISAKADFLNQQTLAKLFAANETLLIEDSIDQISLSEFVGVFNKYQEEIQVKNKIHWRTKFNQLLQKYYYLSSTSQFELDHLCWKLFSEINKEETKKYLDQDCDFFRRSMDIASSYVVCAFLIGYYDGKFLKNLFNDTIKNLMKISQDKLIGNFKEDLERLRTKTNFDNKDRQFVEGLVDNKNFNQRFFFEKFDGSGAMNINMHEMSDLEIILCSLSYFYHFKYIEHKNILNEIADGSFTIYKRILNLIKRNFELLGQELQVS